MDQYTSLFTTPRTEYIIDNHEVFYSNCEVCDKKYRCRVVSNLEFKHLLNYLSKYDPLSS